MGLVFLIGGSRSGKSALAVRLAQASGLAVTFLATAEGRDEEMVERIARHRAARPLQWETLEEPVELRRAPARRAPSGGYAAPDRACRSGFLRERPEGARCEDEAEGEPRPPGGSRLPDRRHPGRCEPARTGGSGRRCSRRPRPRSGGRERLP